MAVNSLDSVCNWTFAGSYPYSTQVVFGVPFSISPYGFGSAGHDVWGSPYYETSGYYYLQHPTPDGPHTPVVQIVPQD